MLDLAGSWGWPTPEAPTPLVAANLIVVVAFAFGLAVATARARRWSWLWLACGATALALPTLAAVPGALAVVLAVAGRAGRRRQPGLGLAIGLLAATTLLGAPPRGPTGLSTILAAAIVAPPVVSAYRLVSHRGRRVVRRSALALGLLGAAVAAAGTAGLVQASDASERGLAAARAALEASRDGDVTVARRHLREATAHMDVARAALDHWWVKPSFAVPVLGQQVAVLERMTGLGATTLGELATVSDDEGWSLDEGRVDLEALGRAGTAWDVLVSTLVDARVQLAAGRSGWLVPPLADRLATLERAIGQLTPDARRAAALAGVLPRLLGAAGPRSYIFLFATPAEAREGGGLVASALRIVAADGRIEVVEALSNGELNQRLAAADATLGQPGDYPASYVAADPQAISQNWASSPDFPTVARAVAQLYPGDAAVDGVLYLDPYAVAALLELTGPVTIEGLAEPLDATNVVSFLLRVQYELFPEQAARKDLLTDLGEQAFGRLLQLDDLVPTELARVLDPVIEEGRLKAWTTDAEDRAVLADFGLDGSFPTLPAGEDVLAVAHVNAGSDKLDAYLDRTIDYDVTLDPATGVVDAELIVELDNRAPLSLPSYVLGLGPSPYPPGTNQAVLVVRSPHELVTASVDGATVAVASTTELGLHRYALTLVVPRGEATVATLRLRGRLERAQVGGRDDYRLRLVAQPLVRPDLVTVRLGLTTQDNGPFPRWVNLPSEQGFRLRQDLTVRAELTAER